MKALVPEKIKKYVRIIQSFLAAFYLGFPSRELSLIGVTGTSGKSTTAELIYHMLKENGCNVGLISTVSAKAAGEEIDTGLHVTTPDPINLQKILKKMVNKGAKYVVLESSSHALAQGRLGLMKFDFAVITNIKRDHLDWHKNWDNYARAKLSVVDRLEPWGKVIVNKDDKKAYTLFLKHIDSKRPQVKYIDYSAKEASKVRESFEGLEFEYSGTVFKVPLVGSYNIENILAVCKIGKVLDLKNEDISMSLSKFGGLLGRMQIMQKKPFYVIVNFSHNTDSLKKSLKSVRKLIMKYKRDSRIITVFGSAGLRDVEKRFLMGSTSAKLSDVTIVTAEDPRTEALYDINSQIIDGAKDSGAKLIERFANSSEYLEFKKKHPNFHVKKKSIFAFDEESVNSRYDSIEFAISIAREGDVVITEGKGHEKSLCFGTKEYPFTDQQAVNKALSIRSKS